MKKTLFIFLFVFEALLPTYALETDTIWYDRSWHETSKDLAGYYRILEQKNDSLWSFMDYYAYNHQLQNSGFLSSLDPEVRTGEFIWYYPNGNKETQGTYDKGYRTGIWHKFYEQGGEKYKGHCVEGNRHGKWEWYFANGALKSEAVYDTGRIEGVRTWYHEDGTKEMEVPFVDGKRDGAYTSWFSSGKVHESATYVKGQLHGEKTTYYESGQIRSKVPYKSGIAGSDAVYYNQEGGVIAIEDIADRRENHRLLWEISGNGLKHPSYLFGTMHVRDPRAFEFSDTLLHAFERSQAYSMEIHPDDLYSYVYARKPTEPEYLLGNELDGGDDSDYEYDSDYSFLFGWDTQWFATLNTLFHRSGPFQIDQMPYFVDAYLYHTAALQGKLTFGLEDVEAHINVGENLPSYRKHFDILSKFNPDEEMVKVYKEGDIHKIAALMDFFTNKEFQYRLLVERNYIMADKIDSLIRQHITFNTCGSAHLPGKEGVIELLQNKGYTLRRMDAFYSGDSLHRPELRNQKGVNHQVFEDDFYQVTFPGTPIEYEDNTFDRWVVMDMIDEIGYTTFRVDWRFDQETFQFNRSRKTVAAVLDIELDDIVEFQEGDAGSNYSVLHVDDMEHFILSDLYFIEEQAVVAQVMVEDKELLETDRVHDFMASLKLIPLNETADDWQELSSDYGSFKISLPQPKPSEAYTLEDPRTPYSTPWNVVRQTGHSNRGGRFLVRHNHYPGTYKHRLREDHLGNMITFYNDMFGTPWGQEITSVQGAPALILEYRFDDDYRTKVQLIERSGHSYVLIGMYHSEDPAADKFFNSFRLEDAHPMELASHDFEALGFSAMVPDTTFSLGESLGLEEDEGFDSFEIDVSALKDIELAIEEVVEELEFNVNVTSETEAQIHSEDYIQSEWVFTDTLASIYYAIEKHEFSEYYFVSDLDSLKRYLLKTGVSESDSIWPLNFEASWQLSHFEGSEVRQADRKLVLNGRSAYCLSVSYPIALKGAPQIADFFEGFKVNEEAPDFDFSQRKARQLLNNLTSSDSSVQRLATFSLSEFPFVTEDLPNIYSAVRKELDLDTNDIFFNANALISKLENLHDSTTIDFLGEVLDRQALGRRTRLRIMEVLSQLTDSLALTLLVDEITSDTIWFVEDEYLSDDILGFVENIGESSAFLFDNFQVVLPLLNIQNTEQELLVQVNSGIDHFEDSDKLLEFRDSIRVNFLRTFVQFKDAHSSTSGVEGIRSEKPYSERSVFSFGETENDDQVGELLQEYIKLLGALNDQDTSFTNALLWLSSSDDEELRSLSIENLLSVDKALSLKTISGLLDKVKDQYAFLEKAFEIGKFDLLPTIYRNKEKIVELQILHRVNSAGYHSNKHNELAEIELLKRKKVKINGEKVYLYIHQYYKKEWDRTKRFLSVSGPQPLTDGEYYFGETALGADRPYGRKDDPKRLISEMINEVKLQAENNHKF